MKQNKNDPRLKVQYGTWHVESNDEECAYWILSDSIEDAVDGSSEMEVFEMTPKYLGKYKLQTKVVRSK